MEAGFSLSHLGFVNLWFHPPNGRALIRILDLYPVESFLAPTVSTATSVRSHQNWGIHWPAIWKGSGSGFPGFVEGERGTVWVHYATFVTVFHFCFCGLGWDASRPEFPWNSPITERQPTRRWAPPCGLEQPSFVRVGISSGFTWVWKKTLKIEKIHKKHENCCVFQKEPLPPKKTSEGLGYCEEPSVCVLKEEMETISSFSTVQVLRRALQFQQGSCHGSNLSSDVTL